MPRKTLRKWTGAALDALTIASKEYRIAADLIRSASRVSSVVRARHFAWAILRSQGYSYPQIGELCGGHDHSTVITALRVLPDATKTRAAAAAPDRFSTLVIEELARARGAIWRDTASAADRELVAQYFQAPRDVATARKDGVVN